MLLSSALLLLLDPALANNGRTLHSLQDSFATGHIVRGRAINFRSNPHETTTRVDILPNGLLMTVPADVTSVTAEVRSEVGSEEVQMTELDAWLHGSVELPALRGELATVELVLLDANSAELKRFTGRMVGNAREYSWSGFTPINRYSTTPCTSRTGCLPEGEEVDADVVSSALLDGGHGLGVDLAGADLYNVAYASVTVSETIATCVGVYDRANTCSEWGYDVVEETIELGFDEMGAVWGGDLGLTHTGTIELRTMLYGQEGRRVSQMRQKLRSPWEDGSSGDNALSLDEDPQTGLGFTTVDGVPWLTVVSDGWTEGAALPVDAKVELSTGETLVIPVESYQRKATPVAPTTSDARELYDLIDSSSFRVNLGGQPLAVADAIRGSEGSSCSAATGDGTPRTDLSLADFDGGPVCMQGTCVSFVGDGAGGYAMSVTQYRWDDNFVGGETNAVITRLDRSGAAVAERAFAFTYTDEITAVFSVEVGFAGDPTNLGLAGKVSLRGQADRRGKQSTLAKGSFYGAVTRDGDGDISLGGADKDALLVALEPSFAVLFSGSPSSCGDDETGYSGQWPKVVSMRGWPDRPPRDETTCKKVALCCRD